MHFTHDSPTEDIFEFFFLSTDILKSNIAFFFFFWNSDQGGKLSKHECLTLQKPHKAEDPSPTDDPFPTLHYSGIKFQYGLRVNLK